MQPPSSSSASTQTFIQSVSSRETFRFRGQPNPCTADVMRATEVLFFPNIHDESSYLICSNVNQYLIKTCPQGTIFVASISHCLPIGLKEPECPVGACQNDGDCLFDLENKIKCHCRVGFTGQTCETNIDECALEGNKLCSTYGEF